MDDGKIVAELVVAAEALFRQSLVEHREWQEELMRFHEQQAQRRFADLTSKRLKDLWSSAELLRQTNEIRTLVAQVERAIH